MKLEEILDEWDRDSEIDRTALGDESLRGPKLHAKWLRIRANEKLLLFKMIEESKRLKLHKHEFYTQGPTKETQALGWEPPAIGRPLNKDVPLYMDADAQTIESNLKIALQREKVDAIDLIFVALKGRGFDIGRKLEDLKRQQGA